MTELAHRRNDDFDLALEMDLDTKPVRAIGSAFDDAAIRPAIHEAGYRCAFVSAGEEVTR